MRSRYSLTSSPLKKAPSIYKRSPKKKFSITNQYSPSTGMHSTQYDNIITEDIVEEKATPKKSTVRSTTTSSPASPRTPYSPANEENENQQFQETSRSTTLNRSLKNRSKSDSFYQPNKQTQSIEDLKNNYQELASLYNNALQRRLDLKNECSSLENELQQEYKQQSKLCRQLKKKADSDTIPSRK